VEVETGFADALTDSATIEAARELKEHDRETPRYVN